MKTALFELFYYTLPFTFALAIPSYMKIPIWLGIAGLIITTMLYQLSHSIIPKIKDLIASALFGVSLSWVLMIYAAFTYYKSEWLTR